MSEKNDVDEVVTLMNQARADPNRVCASSDRCCLPAPTKCTLNHNLFHSSACLGNGMKQDARALTALAFHARSLPRQHRVKTVRNLSNAASKAQARAQPPPASTSVVDHLSPRWLSDVKTRLGTCMTFGLDVQQKTVAGNILSTIAKDWRELVAGSEGYLTSYDRRGLFRYPIAWGEQDPMAHINNIVYNRWAETGRIAWTRNFATYIDQTHAKYWQQLMIPRGEGLILRKITTEYKFPLTYPDRISVYHKLSAKPDASDVILLDCVILSETKQRVAARTTEDIALYDYDAGRKINKQPWLYELLLATWELQERAKQLHSSRVRAILDRVRGLELDSWDRADAVEDVGLSRP